MLYRYFLIAIAVATMLVGVQVPNFIDQYAKRVDARLAEVTVNLRGFQQIADRLHNGSIDALVQKHRTSSDASFRAEAEPIQAMVDRQAAYRLEQIALRGDVWQQAHHIATGGDRALLRETYAAYTFNVPLTRDAVAFGAVLVLAVVFLLEVLALAARLATGRRARA